MKALMKFMNLDRLERLMVAATFAEAGCPDTARWIMDEEKRYAQQRPVNQNTVSAHQRPTLHV
jgi:hypothetical protein